MLPKPDDMPTDCWDVATDKEKRFMLKNPQAMESWIAQCRNEQSTSTMVNTKGRQTRRSFAQTGDMTGESTGADVRNTRDAQWAVEQRHIDEHFDILYQSNQQQDGHNCMYAAMQRFEQFSHLSTKSLRATVVKSIVDRLRVREYDQAIICQAEGCTDLTKIMTGHLLHNDWGTCTCIDAICREKGTQIMVVRKPETVEGAGPTSTVYTYPGTGSRIGSRVSSQKEFDDFNGPILLNYEKSVWSAIRRKSPSGDGPGTTSDGQTDTAKPVLHKKPLGCLRKTSKETI